MEANIKTFQNIPISSIQTFLSNNQEPFQSSQLYSSQRDETFINEDLRKSIFRTIQDPKLFDLIDTDIVQNILNNDPENKTHNFMLRRNDVTHIKYYKGGFFKKHRDYLSTTSNFVEEFTFLLCVTPTEALNNGDNHGAAGGTTSGGTAAVKGGETKLFGYGTSKCYDTSTPGTGLLFRKDLEHEGCELIQGEKHIITLNLYATRRETNDQVLLVTFPNECTDTDPAQDAADCETTKKMRSLLHIASNESLSYVIPVQNLFGMLEAHVRFANKQHRERLGLIDDSDYDDDGDNGVSSSSKPPVIHYECKDFDFETFGVIVKIFNNAYVEEEDLVMARNCMDYFGPISTENILVNLSLVPEEIGVEKDMTTTSTTNIVATNSDTTNTNSIKDDNKRNDEHGQDGTNAKEQQQVQKNSKLKYKDLLDDKSFDRDIIVCENEARMQAVANVAQMLGESFVPFKIAFVEGLICDDMEFIVNVPMTAAACVLGDYNNIFSIWKLCQRFHGDEDVSPHPLNRVNLESNYWAKIPDEYKDKYQALTPGTTNFDCFDWNMWYESEMDEVYDELKINGFGFGLQIGFQKNCDVKATISQSLFKDEDDILSKNLKHPERNVVFLPGLEDHICSSDGNDTSFFHRNKEGMITFSKDQAERTSNYLSSIDFEERVKRQLQQKRFELPQEIGRVNGMFCNEAVYGKANILWVCGVIRLADSMDERSSVTDTTSNSSQKNVFDVWPSREAKDIMVKYNEKWTRGMEDFAEWSDIQSTNDDEDNEAEDIDPYDEDEDDGNNLNCFHNLQGLLYYLIRNVVGRISLWFAGVRHPIDEEEYYELDEEFEEEDEEVDEVEEEDDDDDDRT